MNALPIELVTAIAIDSFELFTTLLRVHTIGQRLCESYPQLYARKKFITVVNINNATKTYLNGKLHSVNGQPAICINNREDWYWHGKRHRENDKPAIEYANGDKKWYWHGKRHRENDKPAFEYANGSKHWYWNG
jgi:hypothetical protein